jgi:hypothetical protein
MGLDTVRRILAFTVIVEIGTGLGLLLFPALVGALLVGGDLAGAGVVVARCLGMTLVALGLACWRGRQTAGNVAAAVRGMLLYNAAIALYLAYVGTADHLGGPLLWPAVVLHAVVAALLATMWRRERNTAEIGS